MKEQQNVSTDEVELGSLVNIIARFLKNLLKLLFLIIAFVKKTMVLTIILVVVGALAGYFIDTSLPKKTPVYENHIIVIPNFESVDYLYETIEGLNAKIASNDSLYLTTVLGDGYRSLHHVEIEPIVDIYNFATRSSQNIEVFKILFQNQDLAEFVEDMTTSKYFKYHRLNFFIKGSSISEQLVENLLNHMNENPHFKKYQELSQMNTEWLIEKNNTMISQVDSLIQASIKYANTKDRNSSVLINDNSDLGLLVSGKQDILYRRMGLLRAGNDETAVIKNVGANYNILKKGLFSVGYKLKLPIIFLVLFYGFFFARFTYKNLKSIAESN